MLFECSHVTFVPTTGRFRKRSEPTRPYIRFHTHIRSTWVCVCMCWKCYHQPVAYIFKNISYVWRSVTFLLRIYSRSTPAAVHGRDRFRGGGCRRRNEMFAEATQMTIRFRDERTTSSCNDSFFIIRLWLKAVWYIDPLDLEIRG